MTAMLVKRTIQHRSKPLTLRSPHSHHYRTIYNTAHYVLPVFGLSRICPSEAIENYLHALHDSHSIPYVLGICTLPLLTKFLIRLPLDVMCNKLHESVVDQVPSANEHAFESFVTILQSAQKKERAPTDILTTFAQCSYKQFEAKFIHRFPSLVGLYLHLSCYIAIEGMTFHEHANSSLEILNNEYLSSTDPYFILPFVNGLGLMFCYALIKQRQAADFHARQRNIKLCSFFIPWSMLFVSTSFHFYILGNMASIALYYKSTMHNDAFRTNVGLLPHEHMYQKSTMEKMSNLYIEHNKQCFKYGVFDTYTKSYNDPERNHMRQHVQAVMASKKLFIPSVPPRELYRNIEDELEYFDDEYDEFMERIDDRNYQRYLENNRDEILIDEHETLILDDEEKQQVLAMNKQKQLIQ